MHVSRPALAGLLILLSGVAQAQSYDGAYRFAGADPSACANPQGDTVPIIVGPNEISFYESRCSLENPVAVRDMDALLYDAECSGEGETWSYRLMILRIEGGIALIRDGFVTQYERCE